MALLAVYDDSHAPVRILASTECHYVINQTLSFILLEITILPTRQAQEIRILCDRPINRVSEIENTVNTERSYRLADFLRLLRTQGRLHQEAVYSFQRTFRFGRGFNTRYPRDLNAKATRPGQQQIEVHIEAQNSFSEIVVIQSSMSSWLPAACYQLRLGFFISRRLWPPIPVVSSILSRYFVRYYDIHILTYTERSAAHLHERNLLEVIKASCLWIKMSPNKGLKPLFQAITSEPTATAAEIEARLDPNDIDYPHSDVWIIVPKGWVVWRRPGREAPVLAGTPEYILFDSPIAVNSFRAYHWVPGASEKYRPLTYLSGRECDTFDLLVMTWWLRPLNLYPLLVSNTAVAIGVFSLTHSIVAAIVAGTVGVALYLLIMWIGSMFDLPGWMH